MSGGGNPSTISASFNGLTKIVSHTAAEGTRAKVKDGLCIAHFSQLAQFQLIG